MALTPEQQSQLDFQAAQNQLTAEAEVSRRAYEKEMEQIRHNNALATAKVQLDASIASSEKMARLEAVRMAKETLIENRRNKPVGERDVTAADITAFADTLINYVNK